MKKKITLQKLLIVPKIIFLTFFIFLVSNKSFSQTVCNASFSHYAGANPDSIHYYPTGSGAVHYSWTFGDGTTSTDHAPWHFYYHPGTYYVCLTIIDSAGVTCDHCDSIHVGANVHICNASFSHYAGANPDSVHYYPTGSGAVHYSWTFGDGTTSTDQYPWHFYYHPGTYYVCLTIIDSAGVTCTSCDSIHVGANVHICNASFSHYAGTNPDSVHYYPTGSGAVHYSWTFGDGTTSTDQYPWHFYSHPGTYWVCLTIIDSAGVTCDLCDSIHVGPVVHICNAAFAHYSLNNPDSMHFYPTGPGAVHYSWTFGDGTTSTDHAPWHFYYHPGTYYVCLTIIDSAGVTCTSCDSIHVGANVHICNASFSHYAGTNPDSVHYYPTGSGAVHYSWTFGDGTTSTDQYPWHFYYHPGTYWVCLTIIDSAGVTCDHCDSVHVGANTHVCNAAFAHYSLNNPDSVHFYPTGPGAVHYSWTFGDGTTSTDHTPWHFYYHPGTYYVCLTIIDSAGVTCTSCDSIHVGTNVHICNASFSHYAGTNPDSVHYYPTGSGAVHYSWTFGDGTTSTDQYPWHFYSHPGTYWVCLTIIDSAGVTCDHCDSIHVGPVVHICNAAFAHYSLNNPDSVHFYPTGSGAVHYSWTFGDGTTSTDHSPWHFYYHPGTYYVCLTIIDSAGVTCTSCDSIHVGANVHICNASFSHYSGANPDSIHYYTTGSGAVHYSWTFGDGTTSTDHSPWHFYYHPGTYYVCLTIIDSAGVTCDHCDSIHVGANVHICNASFSHYSGANPDSIHYYTTGSGAVHYSWTFGDGTTSTDHSPWHFYYHPGTYYVCLTIIDSAGVTCDHCDSIHVGANVHICNASFSHYAGTNPDSVHYYPTGSGAVHYSWTFGDGTTSTDQYPWHFYSHPGTYWVCLTIIDSAGVTCDHCDSIHVGPVVHICNAAFAHYSLNNPDSVHFYSTGPGAVHYSWTFGDGTTSTDHSPWHFYYHPGTYYVCLTIIDSAGVTCTSCDSIHVGANVHICNASFSHYAGTNPDSVHYYPTGSGAVHYSWTFGDGTTSTDQYPWHFYYHPGTYWVCLTIIDSAGVTCDHCDSVHVGANTHVCNAAFAHYSLNNPDSIHFYPVTTGAMHYFWDFGDGATSTNYDPWHLFAHPGTYNICLTIVDSTGDSCTWCFTQVFTMLHSTTWNVRLNPNPMNDFTTVTLTNITDPVEINIYNYSGQLIFRKENLLDCSFDFDTRDLQQGIYLYTVGNGSNYLSKGKLIVIH